MSMAYIRETYGVPAKRGRRVRVFLRLGHDKQLHVTGTITSARGGNLRIRMDGKRLGIFHPTHGVVYLNDDGTVLHDTREPTPTAAKVAGDER